MPHLHVRIAVTGAAEPGFERVPARHIGGADWELLGSPLYATGVAAADVIRVTNEDTGAFEVLVRGRNISVQFYLGEAEADDAAATSMAARAIAKGVASLGGALGAQTPGLIAFTIPVAVGFPAIEAIFADAVKRHAGAAWQYANVYDEATGEPLGWWEA